MAEQLFEIGLAEGAGVFFFLFIALGSITYIFVRYVLKANQEREVRYISTIDQLADKLSDSYDVKGLKKCVEELRQENRAEHDDTQSMLGRVLDRLPARD